MVCTQDYTVMTFSEIRAVRVHKMMRTLVLLLLVIKVGCSDDLKIGTTLKTFIHIPAVLNLDLTTFLVQDKEEKAGSRASGTKG